MKTNLFPHYSRYDLIKNARKTARAPRESFCASRLRFLFSSSGFCVSSTTARRASRRKYSNAVAGRERERRARWRKRVRFSKKRGGRVANGNARSRRTGSLSNSSENIFALNARPWPNTVRQSSPILGGGSRRVANELSGCGVSIKLIEKPIRICYHLSLSTVHRTAIWRLCE